ncbi:signal transduction histidine kinase, nitrogen specific, NtrB [Desulfosporosinus sp. I2]|uniref:ATP-binding protein n=1 Tax=Desulfosporosinus sp. I2 TaxID=1617025 RepID=UPI0006201DFC|nr:ATP-binding protein [Desulfosporosinus sp. I2]KJR46286.1 signal transduction histidine kinase, nitrogen specific, NtrB [Desulfosporosinus sp. I2]
MIKLFPLLQADALNQGKSIVLDLGEIANLEIDSNEIIQLVLNLTRNGLEAMAQDGCLRIKTFVEKQTVVLSFTDEGTGIITEHISKLGTLFFTTKENGSGLGMPI